jgi:hypothetical protein
MRFCRSCIARGCKIPIVEYRYLSITSICFRKSTVGRASLAISGAAMFS